MHSPSYYNLTVKIIISKHNQEVVGSSPAWPTIKKKFIIIDYGIAARLINLWLENNKNA